MTVPIGAGSEETQGEAGGRGRSRPAAGSWRYRRVEGGEAVTLSGVAVLLVDAAFEGAFELDAG